MTRKCSICNQDTETGVYNTKMNFVCRTCLDLFPNIHVDNFRVENGEVIRECPYHGMTEERQREVCIDFIYTIFNRKINPLAFPRMNQFIKKGYTWIGIVRAMEWFYIVKGNSTKKSNNNVGIVPYIYDEAQAFYERKNNELESRFRSQVLPKINESTERTFVKKKKGL